MKKILIIICFLTTLFIHSIEKKNNQNQKNQELIKRTVLILPFLNNNNIEKYDFLSNTIMDALRANLINTGEFNLSNPVKLNEEIEKIGFSKENMVKLPNALSIAKYLESDIVVTGKYIVIEEKIMIQFEAIDVFTGEYALINSVTGELGINLLKLIDDISKDMANKMALKFPKVERSYFIEMSKIFNKENNKNNNVKINFSVTNKIGLGLTISGGVFILSGLTLLIYDLTGYSNILKNNINYYENNKISYKEYNNSYYTFIGLFCSGIVVSAIGLIFTATGIPLIIYENKNKQISINFDIQNSIKIYMRFKI